MLRLSVRAPGLLVGSLCLLVATGCAPSTAPLGGDVPGMFKHRGMSYAHAWGRRSVSRGYGSDASDASLAVLAELGTDWISITPFGFQRNRDDTEFHWGGSQFSETDDRLHAVTAQAHVRGIKVMLKPHIWLRPPAWVGEVEPTTEADWSLWFGSYREFILHYAALARDADIEALCIGNELARTTHRETAWRALVAEIRTVYPGVLTYGAHADEVWDVPFWDALDFIGVSAYFELAGRSSPTREELVAAWQPVKSRLARLAEHWERPVVFTELGYRSVDFAAQYPWKPDDTTPVNLELQADAYAAFFETVWREPWMGGVYWWNWFSFPDDGGYDDDDYTPRNKPAEAVLRQYYSDNSGAAGGRP